MMEKVLKYIESNWDECIKENRYDDGTLIGLPYPYTIPSIGHFNEMYYWDTYFTNVGLLICKRQLQAKCNVDNMLFLVDKYGFMPNGNRTFYLDHSQPPFLSLMVRDIYNYYNDKIWLKTAYETLKKEYEFWMTKRLSSVGLNFYSTNMEEVSTEKKDSFLSRVRIEAENYGDCDLGRHMMACCESGWDISPRMEYCAYNYAPVDLNSLLYMMEKNMMYFAEELCIDEVCLWSERSNKRKNLMIKFMDNGEGILLDYNFEKKKLSKIFSVASFFPLFAGMVNEYYADSILKNLSRLEADFGILTCEKNNEPGIYQWNYPNGWACLQYIVFKGLDNYGYKKEAFRVADKYVKLADKIFDETGNLWEKYNVVDGSINVANEYSMPPMMGWSAGVYLVAKKYIGDI